MLNVLSSISCSKMPKYEGCGLTVLSNSINWQQVTDKTGPRSVGMLAFVKQVHENCTTH